MLLKKITLTEYNETLLIHSADLAFAAMKLEKQLLKVVAGLRILALKSRTWRKKIACVSGFGA